MRQWRKVELRGLSKPPLRFDILNVNAFSRHTWQLLLYKKQKLGEYLELAHIAKLWT